MSSPRRSSPECVVGLDLGTAGARAVVYDREGTALGAATRGYRLYAPRPRWIEQDPDEMLSAGLAATKAAVEESGTDPKTVAAVGLSSVLHSLIVVDREGKPLTRMIAWADTRSSGQVEQIRSSADHIALYHRTGCPLHPMYPLSKIKWVHDQAPDVFARAGLFGSIKDYIIRHLAGANAVDLSIASGSGMLNLARRDWDDEALRIAGVSRDQVPPVVETTASVGGLLPDVANASGLLQGTPVIAGAGDGCLSNLGTGAISPGQWTATIGSSGAVRATVDRPLTDPRYRTWCYYLAEGRWVAGAAISNAGIIRDWMRGRIFGPIDGSGISGQEFDDLVAEVPAGSGGLVFLPHLAGERAPFWNANARGVCFGLSMNHDRRHIARATLEGVCYRMRDVYLALLDVAGEPAELRTSGGFAKSPVGLQMLSDVLGRDLKVLDVDEASALGAAALGLIGVGIWKSMDDVIPVVGIRGEVEPDPATHQLYHRVYDLYQRLYWKLQHEFDDVCELQAELLGSSGVNSA